jgi:hypothetical protein
MKGTRVQSAVICVLILFSYMTAEGQQVVDRFFKTNSTWYTKIPTSPQLMTNSSNYINDVSINSSLITVNNGDWSVPIWYAQTDTRVVTVTGSKFATANGWDKVPIPSEAKSAGMSVDGYRDRHMSIMSGDGRYVWDFYGAQRDASGSWTTSALRRWDLGGLGFSSPYDYQGSVRACPTSLLHGLITYDEITKRQYINHALAFSYWGDKIGDHNCVDPCNAYRGGINPRTWAMTLGYRLQLDPALDINSLGLSAAGKIIARAMQEYGMIFVENCGQGCNSVYAEDLESKSYSWNGVISSLTLAPIPINRLRVLEPVAASQAPAPPTGLHVMQ